MTWLQWAGVIVIVFIALRLFKTASEARKKKRFGIAHIWSPGFLSVVLFCGDGNDLFLRLV